MTEKLPCLIKPIVYHAGIDNNFDSWAAACGYKPAELRLLSEQTIRNRHDQATLRLPTDGLRFGN